MKASVIVLSLAVAASCSCGGTKEPPQAPETPPAPQPPETPAPPPLSLTTLCTPVPRVVEGPGLRVTATQSLATIELGALFQPTVSAPQGPTCPGREVLAQVLACLRGPGCGRQPRIEELTHLAGRLQRLKVETRETGGLRVRIGADSQGSVVLVDPQTDLGTVYQNLFHASLSPGAPGAGSGNPLGGRTATSGAPSRPSGPVSGPVLAISAAFPWCGMDEGPCQCGANPGTGDRNVITTDIGLVCGNCDQLCLRRGEVQGSCPCLDDLQLPTRCKCGSSQ